jgi:hypothetical protein
MSTRRANQLIYGTLYALIWLIIFGAIYFIFVRPFTNGPAALPCTPNTCAPTSTAPIATSSVSLFVTSPGDYTFLTQAVDTDPDFGAQVLNYQIDLYDASNTLIESVPAQSFIYPSQNKYLVVPNVAVAQPVDHAALEVTGASWIASSTLGAIPQFVLQNTQVVTNSTTIAVSGQLTNANIGSFEQVEILVIFNDGNGNPIGSSQTEIDNLQAGATNNFSVTYPAGPSINPAQNQIIVYALR